MREDDVDPLLARWEERLARVDDNLLALEADPAYQMLAGGARAGLRGRTRQVVEPALEALSQLFQHRETLAGLLNTARGLRAELGFFGRDEKLAAIEELLTGPSIILERPERPVKERNLLDPSTSTVSILPEQLLAEMTRSYQIARDAVAEVGAAWTRLEPLLGELEQSLVQASADATRLGLDAAGSEISSLEAALSEARGDVTSDPLGLASVMDAGLLPRVRALCGMLADAQGEVERVATKLVATEATLAEVAAALSRTSAALARAAAEVAGLAAVIGDREAREHEARGLAAWRAKLSDTATAGRVHAAAGGLARWFDAARARLAAEKMDAARIVAAEGKRSELLGRLSGRRAQAAALGDRGHAVPPGLEALARAAERALHQGPTDLDLAAGAVERYEAEVVAYAARSRQ